MTCAIIKDNRRRYMKSLQTCNSFWKIWFLIMFISKKLPRRIETIFTSCKLSGGGGGGGGENNKELERIIRTTIAIFTTNAKLCFAYENNFNNAIGAGG